MNKYKKFLQDIIAKYPFSFSCVIKKQYDKIWKYLIESYPMLEGHPISEYVYWELNDIKEFPKCQNAGCSNAVKFININDGYRKCCSIKCTNQSSNHIDKVKSAIENDPAFWKKRAAVSAQTKLNRYGDKNYNNVDKAKTTRYGKNGGHYHSDDFTQKTKNTKSKKYDDENYCNTDKAKKTIEYIIKEDPLYYKKRADKVKATTAKIYGDENYRNTIKAAETDRSNHGGILHTQTDEFKQAAAKNRRLTVYTKLIADPRKSLMMSFDEFEQVSVNNQKLKYKCKKCGHEFEIQHHHGNNFLYLHNDCPICFPKLYCNTTSNEEKEFIGFLESKNIQLYKNTRSIIHPLELDVYIPDKKIAFEFDGLYWHSEINKPDKKYHLQKTEQCEKNGIRLVHIFENEWRFKRSIVESRIMDILGNFQHVVFARKCVIAEIDSKVSRNFLDENHIQGNVNADVKLGLFYNNELISLMTFGKSRFSKKYEWELIRFCNKLGYHIPGAAGKLLKYFERTYRPQSLISYADRRWSQGKLYYALGFQLNHISPPDYWYWNSDEFGNRIKYQKYRLAKILKKFDPLKTEVENMYDNGYNRIFDCGNLVFTKEYA